MPPESPTSSSPSATGPISRTSRRTCGKRSRSTRSCRSTKFWASRSRRRRCSPVSRCKRYEPVPEDVRRAADVLERRYAVSILYASHQGCTRFTEFRRALGTIPPATLVQRLGELERAGVLRRELRDTRPPHVEYVLTAEGERLRSLL